MFKTSMKWGPSIKRFTALAICVAMLLALGIAGPVTAYASGITVTIDGQRVHFVDVQPAIVQDRTMVPMRGVFEHMGFDVGWNNDTSTATLSGAGTYITVRIGDAFITVNGSPQFPEVPPQIVAGRFMLPLRAVAEASGANVGWDGATRTVLITSPPTVGQVPTPTPTPTPTPPPEEEEPEPEPTPTPSPTPVPTSDYTLTNRRLTASELDAWVRDYNRRRGASTIETEIVRLVNVERVADGRSVLEVDPYLMKAARFKSQEMADLDYLSHTSPVYGTFTGIPALFGADAYAENIAHDPDASARDFVDYWMDSTTHRNNILHRDYSTIGVGVSNGRATVIFGVEMTGAEDPPPTLSMGTQTGNLVAGTPGRVTFEITTENLPNGNYEFILQNVDRLTI
jgi:uncharacterized protein YkwD